MTLLSITYVLITFGLALSILQKPHMVLRPSMWFALIMTIQLNAAAAFTPDGYIVNSNFFSYGYAQILGLRWLTVLFPFWLLILAHLTPNLNSISRKLYYRCRLTSNFPKGSLWGRNERILLLLTIAISLTVFCIYFLTVPLTNTGLWAIFFDPANAGIAREESLKMVSSPIVRYGIRWHRIIFAPMLLGTLWFYKRRNLDLRSFLFYGIAPLIILSVMIYGSRSAAGQMLIFGGIVFMLRRGVAKGGIFLLCMILTTLIIAALLTILRSRTGDVGLSFPLVLQYLVGSIFDRAFVLPFHTGVLYNFHASEHGLLMGSSIRPLAFFLGVDYVNISNIIGQLYIPGALETVVCNTCCLFDFQSSFGWIVGSFVTLFSLFIIDHFLFAFKKLRGYVLVVFLSIFLLTSYNLVITSLTISLNTGGILWITVFAWWAGKLLKRRRNVIVPFTHMKKKFDLRRAKGKLNFRNITL